MKNKRVALILLVLGVLLGITSLVLGNSVFLALGVQDELNRSIFSISAALVFTLAGFFISIVGFLKDHQDNVQLKIEKLGENIANGFNIERYDGLKGMETISYRIQNAKLVLNTRLIHPRTSDKDKIYAEEARIWERKGLEALSRGVRFRDVVLNAGNLFAKDMIEKLKNSKSIDPTRYRASNITGKADPYINFIVIEYQQGNSEVWFGWVMSPDGEVVGDVFRSVDQGLVNMFKKLHEQLFIKGDEILNMVN